MATEEQEATTAALAEHTAPASVHAHHLPSPTLAPITMAGGIALFYVAAKLLVPDHADDDETEAVQHLWRAVRMVALADIIMSLDNVIAVAGAAGGDTVLLVFGLAISVPLIVAGASLTMLLLTRLPILAWAGAALLGWIGGDMVAADPIVADNADMLGSLENRKADFASAIGATGVLLIAAVRRRYTRLSKNA